MKHLFIALALCLSVTSSKAQNNGVPDTLVFLKQIIANKNQYIGHPFSVLENALLINVKYFFPFADIHSNRFWETSTNFAFYYPTSADEIYLTYPSLNIYWEAPYHHITQSFQLRPPGSFGAYNPAVSAHYSNRVVTDIILRQ